MQDEDTKGSEPGNILNSSCQVTLELNTGHTFAFQEQYLRGSQVRVRTTKSFLKPPTMAEGIQSRLIKIFSLPCGTLATKNLSVPSPTALMLPSSVPITACEECLAC